MSWFYRLAYRIGMKPWEEMAELPIARQIATLLDREQQEREPPYGTALDLGCGSGIWSLELARRGFQVTGVDLVPKALRAAQRRVEEAGAEVRLVHGDLTALRDAGVGSGFGFLLDFGAIHGLSDAQREAVGREVEAVAAPGATMLLLAWTPARRGPLPRGMGRDDVERTFPAWRIVDETVADVSGSPGFVQRSGARFYRLRRD